jgi:hypothetical protein
MASATVFVVSLRTGVRQSPTQSLQCMRLEAESAAEPLGIDTRAPRLS